MSFDINMIFFSNNKAEYIKNKSVTDKLEKESAAPHLNSSNSAVSASGIWYFILSVTNPSISKNFPKPGKLAIWSLERKSLISEPKI